MHDVWSYARSAVRSFLKTPVSASAVLLTLVLSLGASSTIFSVVNGVLLTPLPFRDSGRLVAVWTKTPDGHERGDMAPADFWDFRREARGFTDIAAVSTAYWNVNWSDGEQSARLKAAITSSNLLSVLGINPLLGPGFDAQHDSPTGEQAVLLSHGMWRNRLGANPHIIGKSIVLDSQKFTVRGVLPEAVRFPGDDTDVWLPPSFLGKEMTLRGESFLFMVGRLKAETTPASGRAQLKGIASRLAVLYPATNTGRSIALAPLGDSLVERVRTPLYLLLGAVGCMLLIACINVSGLLLGRTLGRQQEMAVRTALGAGRMSLVCQPILESVWLALAGGGLGLLAGRFATPLLLSLAPGLPHAANIGFDGRVVLVTFLLALFCGLVVGAIPAYWSAGADLRSRLAAGGRGSTFGGGASRMADALIVGQVTLALVLLIGAGLLTKSFIHLVEIKPGFDPGHAVTMRVTLPDAPYSEIETRRAFYRRLLDEVAAMPGVEAVGATSRLPLSMEDITSNLVIEGRPLPSPAPLVGKRMISEDYFKAMRIPLLTGRPFDRNDGIDQKADLAVIVNQTLARRYWPGQAPLGKRIWLGGHAAKGIWMTIVGVVGDVHHLGLDAEPEPEVFVPRTYSAPEGMTLVARTSIDPRTIIAGIRKAVHGLDPTVSAYNINLLSQVLDKSLAKRRFSTTLLLVFAALAVLLTLVGVYGSIAEWTRKHRRDIAIRLAIGAQRGLVLGLVLRRGMTLTCAGLLIGLGAALALRRMLESLLFGVSSGDPLTYLAMPLLMAAFALIAVSLPALRSSRLDPLEVLREE